MSNALKNAAACVLLLLCCSSAAPAQETDHVVLVQELASLRAAIQELSGLMESMLEQQQTALDQQSMELALRRLAMAREELTPIKKELREAENDRRMALDDQKLLEAELDRVNDQLADAVNQGDEEAVQRMRNLPEQINGPLQRIGDQIWSLDQRIIELEGDLAEKEDALTELGQAIDQWLGIQ
jgi:chromosome segregation ATPase